MLFSLVAEALELDTILNASDGVLVTDVAFEFGNVEVHGSLDIVETKHHLVFKGLLYDFFLDLFFLLDFSIAIVLIQNLQIVNSSTRVSKVRVLNIFLQQGVQLPLRLG